MTTELGRYLAYQQKDKEDMNRVWTGSLLNDYWQVNEKVGVTFTVGVKERWVGSAFYVVGAGATGSDYGFVTATGTGYYLTGDGYGMGDWGYIASGTG